MNSPKYHKCAQIALFSFLFTLLLVASPALSIAAISAKKITITRTVNIVNQGAVRGPSRCFWNKDLLQRRTGCRDYSCFFVCRGKN